MKDDAGLGHSGGSGGGEKSKYDNVLKDLLMGWPRGIRKRMESRVTPCPGKLWEWKEWRRCEREHERKKWDAI